MKNILFLTLIMLPALLISSTNSCMMRNAPPAIQRMIHARTAIASQVSPTALTAKRTAIISAASYGDKNNQLHFFGDDHQWRPVMHRKQRAALFDFANAAARKKESVHFIAEDALARATSVCERINLTLEHPFNLLLVTKEARARGFQATNVECRPHDNASIQQFTQHWDSLMHRTRSYHDHPELNKIHQTWLTRMHTEKAHSMGLLKNIDPARTLNSLKPFNMKDGIILSGVAMALPHLLHNPPIETLHWLAGYYLAYPDIKNALERLFLQSSTPINASQYEHWQALLVDIEALHTWYTHRNAHHTLFLIGDWHKRNMTKVPPRLDIPEIHTTELNGAPIDVEKHFRNVQRKIAHQSNV